MSNNRRKTKTERELVADIKKAFNTYCNSRDTCNDCKYRANDEWCVHEYLSDLLVTELKEDN